MYELICPVYLSILVLLSRLHFPECLSSELFEINKSEYSERKAGLFLMRYKIILRHGNGCCCLVILPIRVYMYLRKWEKKIKHIRL